MQPDIMPNRMSESDKLWEHMAGYMSIMCQIKGQIQCQNICPIEWQIDGCRIVFGIFLPEVLDLFWLSFLVPFALYLQQFGTRTCHFAWYLLHFGMVTLHFAWYLLHLAMFAFHFEWYLLPLICMVFATLWYFKRWCGFLEGSLGFHLGLDLRFHLGFHLRFHLRFHLDPFRVSLGLGFHLGFNLGFL